MTGSAENGQPAGQARPGENAPPPENGHLRVLFVEDTPDDVELLLRELRRGGYEPDHLRVDSEVALRESLADERWQIVIVDYSVPGFGGLQALQVIAELRPNLPGVVVSGSIGEEVAVETLKAGAFDYVLKDNLTRFVSAVGRAMRDAEGRRQYRVAVDRLRLTQFTVDHASQGILTIVEDGTTMYVNEAMERLVDAPPGGLIGQRVWEMSPVFTPDSWPLEWREVKRMGTKLREVAVALPDRGQVFLAISSTYFTYGGDEFIVSYVRDVTERVAARRELGTSEEKYRQIVETAGEGIWMIDREQRTTFANAQLATMLGFAADEMLGCIVTDFVFEEDLEDHHREMEARRRGDSGHFERRFRLQDGRELWTLVSAVPLQDDDGAFAGALGMFTDITARKAAEQALSESEARYRRIIEGAREGIGTSDAEGRIEFANRRMNEMFGYAEGELIGMPVTALMVEEDAAAFASRIIHAPDGGDSRSSIRFRRKDGSVMHAYVSTSPVVDEAGAFQGYHAMISDVSDLVSAEQALSQTAERLRHTVEGAVEAMGSMVATRDPYTAGHETRVTELAEAIAAEMGLDEELIAGLRLAGNVHDVGKLAVPAEILTKPARLNEIEFALIKGHSQAAFDILKPIEFDRPVAEIVIQHHERLDGSGYPRSLKGDEILLEARIMAVADVVEAMASHRPYRAALGIEAALEEVRSGAGTRYDSAVVAACERVFAQGFEFAQS